MLFSLVLDMIYGHHIHLVVIILKSTIIINNVSKTKQKKTKFIFLSFGFSLSIVVLIDQKKKNSCPSEQASKKKTFEMDA